MIQTKKKEVQSALFLRQPEFHTGKAGEAGIAIAGLLLLMGLFGTIWGFSSCFALPVSLPVQEHPPEASAMAKNSPPR